MTRFGITGNDEALQGGLNAGTAQWAARQRAAQDQAELEAMERWRETQAELERQSLNQRGMFEAAAEDRWWRKQLFDEAGAYFDQRHRTTADQTAEQQRQATAEAVNRLLFGGGDVPGGGAAPYAQPVDPGQLPGGLDSGGAPQAPWEAGGGYAGPFPGNGVAPPAPQGNLDSHIDGLRMQRAGSLATQLYKLGVPALDWRQQFKANELEDLIPRYAQDAERQDDIDTIMSMGFSEDEANAFLGPVEPVGGPGPAGFGMSMGGGVPVGAAAPGGYGGPGAGYGPLGGLDPATVRQLPMKALQDLLAGHFETQRRVSMENQRQRARMDAIGPEAAAKAQAAYMAAKQQGASEELARAAGKAAAGMPAGMLKPQLQPGTPEFEAKLDRLQQLFPSATREKLSAFALEREADAVNQEAVNISGRATPTTKAQIDVDDAVMEAEDRLDTLQQELKEAQELLKTASKDTGWFGGRKSEKQKVEDSITEIKADIEAAKKARREAVGKARSSGAVQPSPKSEDLDAALDQAERELGAGTSDDAIMQRAKQILRGGR